MSFNFIMLVVVVAVLLVAFVFIVARFHPHGRGSQRSCVNCGHYECKYHKSNWLPNSDESPYDAYERMSNRVCIHHFYPWEAEQT